MASGPGGLARGLQAGIPLGMEARRQRQERQQQRHERARKLAKAAHEHIQQAMSNAEQFVENMDERGIPRSDPRVQRELETYKAEIVSTAEALRRDLPDAAIAANLPAPDAVSQRFDRRMSALPTPTESAATEGRSQATTALSAAGTVAGVEGVSRREALEGQDVIPSRSPTGNDVDIVFADGTRQPADAIRVRDRLLVADPGGNFVSPEERFPDREIASIEPARRRSEEFQAGQRPFMREDFVTVQPGQAFDVQMESGVGPLDYLSGALRGTPVAGPIFREIAGDEAGAEQRRADRFFKRLDINIGTAFRPGESSRISNQQLELARSLVPSYGAFATEAGTTADLRTLRDMLEEQIGNSLEVVNDSRYADALRQDEQVRLTQLGSALDQVNALLNVSNDPQFGALRSLGKSPAEASPEAIADALLTMPDKAARSLLDSLDGEKRAAVNNALKRR